MISMNACAQRKIVASNNIITRDVAISNYDHIEVQGIPYVVYSQTPNQDAKLTISASDNLIDLLLCEVSGNTLVVKLKEKVNVELKKNAQLTVVTSSKQLSSANLMGSGDLVIKEKLTTNTLDISLKGSGDIKATEIDCRLSSSVNLMGSGDIQINTLNAPKSNLLVKGSGDLVINVLNGKTTSSELNGSGDLAVRKANITESITANLVGSGDLDMHDISTNSIYASVSGSGDVKLSGSAQIAEYKIKGSGDLSANNLEAKLVSINVMGSGDATCWVTEILNSTIEQSGTVRYRGNPSEVINHTNKKARQL